MDIPIITPLRGPLLAGGVEPLVVGAFAERNQRAHRLVSELAEAAGPRVQRESAVARLN